MLTIRDHNKNEYPLLAVKSITEDLNSNPVLELKIPKQNNLDLKLIDKLWEINYQTVYYKIMYVKQVTKGGSFYLDVRAIPLFYWDFDKQIVHESKDGHYTGTNAFTDLFNGTGYQYVLVDSVEAIQIEGFGKGETRLEMFKRLIERFGLEFYIVGKTVYLKKLIGNDSNFQYRYKLNASNVSKSIDASNYFTHIKGFGNFEESSEDYLKSAKLKREYTSPLASVLGKYEGKPIVDGRIKDTATMDLNLKRAVEESLEISIEGNLHDVRSIYAEAVPTIGDRVFLIDERIGLEQEIRIHTLKRTYDVHDKLIDCEVTFGSQNIRDRHKSNLSTVAKNMADLLAGKIQLPFDVLESMAKDLLLKIQSVDSELLLDNGIFAIDKANPNNILGLNSAGIYISTDGGETAPTVISADGIVANAITSGQILTHLVRVVGTQGLFSIDGDVAKWTDASNLNRYTEIRPEGAHFRNGHIRISTSSGRDVINNGFILRNPAVSWTYPHSLGTDVRQGDGEFSKNYILTSSDQFQTGGFFSFSHEARYLRVFVTLNTLSSAPAARARLRMTNQYSNEIRTTSNDDLEYGSRLLMDIGEPLDYGVRRYCYVEFRKEGDGDTIAGLRINTREQTDFP